jgi:hypothetical protein
VRRARRLAEREELVHGRRVQAIRAAQGVTGRDGAAGERDRSVAACASKGPDIQNAGPRRGPKLLESDDGLVAVRATGIRITKDTHPAESRTGRASESG